MTACVIFSPSYASASAFSLASTNAEICCGANVLRLAADLDFDVSVAVRPPSTTLKGTCCCFFLHFVELATDKTLHRENGVRRIGYGLTFGGLANKSLAIF